jgi:hypothetical protein
VRPSLPVPVQEKGSPMEFGMVAIVGGIVLGWALERIKSEMIEKRSEKARQRRLAVLMGRETELPGDRGW